MSISMYVCVGVVGLAIVVGGVSGGVVLSTTLPGTTSSIFFFLLNGSDGRHTKIRFHNKNPVVPMEDVQAVWILYSPCQQK